MSPTQTLEHQNNIPRVDISPTRTLDHRNNSLWVDMSPTRTLDNRNNILRVEMSPTRTNYPDSEPTRGTFNIVAARLSYVENSYWTES